MMWDSGRVIWSLRGDGCFEAGGKERGEDVHDGHGWDAMMQWGELGGLEVGSEGRELIDKEG